MPCKDAVLRAERGAPMDRLSGSARYSIDTDLTRNLRGWMQYRLAAPDLQLPYQLPAHNAGPNTLCLLASHQVPRHGKWMEDDETTDIHTKQ
jgi:hypothetical protein